MKHAFFGEYGSVLLEAAAGTTSASGDFCAIVAINDTVIDAITWNAVDGSDIEDTITIPAGVVLYGRITAITLTSGVVQCINAPSYGI